MDKITLPEYKTIFSVSYPKSNFIFGKVEKFEVEIKKIPTNIDELRAVSERLILKKSGGIKPFSLNEFKLICKEFKINCNNKKQAIENLKRLL